MAKIREVTIILNFEGIEQPKLIRKECKMVIVFAKDYDIFNVKQSLTTWTRHFTKILIDRK